MGVAAILGDDFDLTEILKFSEQIQMVGMLVQIDLALGEVAFR